MPTQVQVRGAVQATQEGRTLVSRELDINTSDGRLAVHNGTTAGGVPHVNCFDAQNQEFTYAAAAGTNTITMTLAKAPAAYAAGQSFTFKAANTNTGSATLNVNSLGAKTIKKKDVGSGTIAVLAAGDIIAGGIYSVFYDGTDMILESVDKSGNAGALILLGSQTASASSVLDFTSLITSDYDTYIFFLEDIRPATNNVNLTMRTSTDNSTYATSGYLGGGNISTNAPANTAVASATNAMTIATGVANPAASAICGRVELHNPLGATNNKRMTSHVSFIENSTNIANQTMGVEKSSTSALLAVRFLMSSGNITSGTIRMYGVKNS